MASKAYELATLARDATTLTGNAQTMGDANTLDGHDSSYFAVATHNHDSWYLRLDGGTLTDYVQVHATPVADMQLANKKYVDDELLSVSTTLTTSKADASHNHDVHYSPIAHNHDTHYSAISHHHDVEYLKISGGVITGSVTAPTPVIDDQIATKSYVDQNTSSNHSHGAYSLTSHNHDSVYAKITDLAGYSTDSELTTGLSGKVDSTTYQDMLDENADKTYVDTANSLKADKTYVDTNFSLKADKTYVDTQITALASDTELTTLQAQVTGLEDSKASVALVNSLLLNKVDASQHTSDLSLKADLTDVANALSVKAEISYVDNKVADLVESAPQALNTLNELAQALGDDEAFSTTIATQMGTKADTTYVDSQIASVTAGHFSGSWVDLTNKPSIPSLTSELTNDSGFSTTSSSSYGPYNATGLASANGDGTNNHIGFINTVDTSTSIQVFKNGIKLQGPIIDNNSSDVPDVWNPVGYDYIAYRDTNDIVFESHMTLSSIDTLEVVVIYQV